MDCSYKWTDTQMNYITRSFMEGNELWQWQFTSTWKHSKTNKLSDQLLRVLWASPTWYWLFWANVKTAATEDLSSYLAFGTDQPLVSLALHMLMLAGWNRNCMKSDEGIHVVILNNDARKKHWELALHVVMEPLHDLAKGSGRSMS